MPSGILKLTIGVRPWAMVATVDAPVLPVEAFARHGLYRTLAKSLGLEAPGLTIPSDQRAPVRAPSTSEGGEGAIARAFLY